MLYPIIRGLATLNLVRGNLATADELSLQGLRLAEQSGRPDFTIDALSVRCYTTLYYGHLKDCRSTIENCLALYREHQGEKLTYPVPQDAATAALALLPTVRWLMGDSTGCESAITEGLAHVERLDRDFDRALMHAWIAGVRYTQRRYAEAADHAMKAITISQKHGYREWLGTGTLLLLMAQCALTPSLDAVQQATAVCQSFASEGVGLNASYYLWGLARGYSRIGAVDAAQKTLDKAFEAAEASAESRMHPELLILRAELESDRGLAEKHLTQSLSLAEKQGAIATALRAAATLVLNADRDAEQSREARAMLDFLNGRDRYPADVAWMRSGLDRLRRSLSPQ
jgi:tetratricopeptide (TPR) repeat protein